MNKTELVKIVDPLARATHPVKDIPLNEWFDRLWKFYFPEEHREEMNTSLHTCDERELMRFWRGLIKTQSDRYCKVYDQLKAPLPGERKDV